MAICTTWGIMSILLVCVDVSFNGMLHAMVSPLRIVLSLKDLFYTTLTASTCANRWQFSRWLAIGVFDGITEVMFAAMAMYLVTGLQMKISRKCLVVLAFAVRLL